MNDDGNVNIADVTALIDYLLSGNDNGINIAGADVNGDSNVNIADVTALIDYLLSNSAKIASKGSIKASLARFLMPEMTLEMQLPQRK